MPAEASAELWIRLTAPALVPVYDVRIGIGYNLLSRIKIILEFRIRQALRLHTVNVAYKEGHRIPPWYEVRPQN